MIDLFKPQYSKLRLFLKKYLPQEISDVIDITYIDTNTSLMQLINDGDYPTPRSRWVWTIEVACKDEMDRGESVYHELRENLKNLILLYGEKCDTVIARRVYVKKGHYV